METSEPYSTHADLRSPSHASTRSAKQSQKYYDFRSGPMSRIGQPVFSVPDSPRSHPFDFVRAPLLTHPNTVRVRTWTKRDQFDDRTWDIWPLDRKDHKVGRRRRGRGCNYVPARWEMERSMKGRKHLIEGDELETEEDGAEDAAVALDEGRVLTEYDVAGDDYLNVDGGEASPIKCPRGSSDMQFDTLSDLSSEADDSDWEFVDAN